MPLIKIMVIPVGIAFENAYDLNPDIVLHKDYDGSPKFTWNLLSCMRCLFKHNSQVTAENSI